MSRVKPIQSSAGSHFSIGTVDLDRPHREPEFVLVMSAKRCSLLPTLAAIYNRMFGIMFICPFIPISASDSHYLSQCSNSVCLPRSGPLGWCCGDMLAWYAPHTLFAQGRVTDLYYTTGYPPLSLARNAYPLRGSSYMESRPHWHLLSLRSDPRHLPSSCIHPFPQ